MTQFRNRLDAHQIEPSLFEVNGLPDNGCESLSLQEGERRIDRRERLRRRGVRPTRCRRKFRHLKENRTENCFPARHSAGTRPPDQLGLSALAPAAWNLCWSSRPCSSWPDRSTGNRSLEHLARRPVANRGPNWSHRATAHRDWTPGLPGTAAPAGRRSCRCRRNRRAWREPCRFGRSYCHLICQSSTRKSGSGRTGKPYPGGAKVCSRREAVEIAASSVRPNLPRQRPFGDGRPYDLA